MWERNWHLRSINTMHAVPDEIEGAAPEPMQLYMTT